MRKLMSEIDVDTEALLKPVTPRGRQRVRLGSLGEASPIDEHESGETEAVDPVMATAQSISNENLAYALPGGLAKLAIPKWIYAKHLKLLEDVILKIAKGESVRVGVSMPPRHGKPIWIEEPILMGDGSYKKLGEVKVGDKVLYGKYSGTDVTIDGNDYLIVRESDILAII